ENPTLETPAPEAAPAWTAEDAEALYHVDAWSDGYFFFNAQGHVAVAPSRDRAESVDVYQIVKDLQKQSVSLPVLLRFQDVLQSRVVQLNEAFNEAIREFDYQNRYTAVYPIKVNQLHEVVEEVLDAGRP